MLKRKMQKSQKNNNNVTQFASNHLFSFFSLSKTFYFIESTLKFRLILEIQIDWLNALSDNLIKSFICFFLFKKKRISNFVFSCLIFKFKRENTQRIERKQKNYAIHSVYLTLYTDTPSHRFIIT